MSVISFAENLGWCGATPVSRQKRCVELGVLVLVASDGLPGASTDFTTWSAGATHLPFVCVFIGGVAGSTTCSIKTIRWLVVLKAFRRDLFVASTPRAVRPARPSGAVVDEEMETATRTRS